MSPRPRKASDEAVFAAAGRAMSRRGPRQLTLADIAAEAGLSAGALVQRFGSKRALLLAASARFARGTAAMFASLRTATRSPVEAIYAYGDCLAQLGASPDALAHHLAWLQQDLTDPDFRRLTLRQARTSRRELARLAADAVRRGLLRREVDPARLARAIEVTVGGSLMAWAVYQDGTATRWLREDLDGLLAPLLARGVRPPPRRPATRG